jgi:hypothetical protein
MLANFEWRSPPSFSQWTPQIQIHLSWDMIVDKEGNCVSENDLDVTGDIEFIMRVSIWMAFAIVYFISLSLSKPYGRDCK